LADAPELLDIRVSFERGGLVQHACASSPLSPFQLDQMPNSSALLQPGYCLSKIAVPFMVAELYLSGCSLEEPVSSLGVRPCPPELESSSLYNLLNHEVPPGPTHIAVRLTPDELQEEMLLMDDPTGEPGFSEVRNAWVIERIWQDRHLEGRSLLPQIAHGLFPPDAARARREEALIPNACVDGDLVAPIFEEISWQEIRRCQPALSSYVSPSVLVEAAALLRLRLPELGDVFSRKSAPRHDSVLQRESGYVAGLLDDPSSHAMGEGWSEGSLALPGGMLVGGLLCDGSGLSIAAMSTGMLVPHTERVVSLRDRLFTELCRAVW
jgi:hypothetical protein